MKGIKLRVYGGCLWMAFLLMSCGTTQQVVYFQDVAQSATQKIQDSYEVVIGQDDLLAIIITSRDNELAQPFNMPMVFFQVDGTNYGQQRLVGYLVDRDGMIDFPILGTMKVSGLTRGQLAGEIKGRLIDEGFIKDPVVTVQFLNFKVSVLGEVNNPGSFEVSGDRITLLDALSRAKDLTIYGRRDRVAVIREEEGVRTIHYLDLRSADLFESPYYYLQQNDIVYVEPNKTKSAQSQINQNNSMSVWLSAISTIISVLTLVFVSI